jgi:hypothetical protein
MFVKFDCGCVGLVVGDSSPIVIDPCDLSHPECWEPLQFSPRDMGDKGVAPLTAEQTAHYVKAIGGLIADGYAFRKVRDLLAKPKT